MKTVIIELPPGSTYSTYDNGVVISNTSRGTIKITIDRPPYEKDDYCKKCGVLIKLRK